MAEVTLRHEIDTDEVPVAVATRPVGGARLVTVTVAVRLVTVPHALVALT